MAAESENTASLSAVTLMPSVAQAAGLSFMARSRSPKPLRRTAITTRYRSENTTAITTTWAGRLLVVHARDVERLHRAARRRRAGP